jgi:[acyl-carrier-protein] S-malonyltransferase
MGKSAVIFTGQGAQSVGMGRDFFEASRAAREVYEKASQVLGFDIAKLCFEGPAGELERTDIQQPAIFVTSAAIWAALREAGASITDFVATGGLSLGEYTALHAAEGVDFADALRLVRRRGELMQAAALASPSGMVSLIGADENAANAICEAARHGEVLSPANFNCPGQIVIAGTRSACERALKSAEQHGCRAVPLAVAGAFHTALMKSAAEGLTPVLRDTPFRRPLIKVIGNVNAEYHAGPDEIRASLAKQVTHPVRWQKCVERMIADGVDRFIELGPGRVLTGLMRKINREVTTINVSAFDSVAAACGTGL